MAIALFFGLSELHASSKYSVQAWLNWLLFTTVLSSRKGQMKVLFVWVYYYLVALVSLLIAWILSCDATTVERASSFLPAASIARLWSATRRWWPRCAGGSRGDDDGGDGDVTSVAECYATMLVVVALMLRDCQLRSIRRVPLG